jgi:hypothetical protein
VHVERKEKARKEPRRVLVAPRVRCVDHAAP